MKNYKKNIRADHFELNNGKTIRIECDENGNFLRATTGDAEEDKKIRLSNNNQEDHEFDGKPVTYISPGSVIITQSSFCYTKRLPDGRTQTICYP